VGANEAERFREYEQRFRRAGLPLFIGERSAATDVFNRAAPLLALVFLGETLGAMNLDWSAWANVAAVAGSLGVLLAAIALTNKARGHPAAAIPQDVGRVELAAANLLLLALVYGVVGFVMAFRSSVGPWAGCSASSARRLSSSRARSRC
jgi:hypothetical protein